MNWCKAIYKLLFFVGWLLPISSFGQPSKVDSLLRLLPTARTQEARLDLFLQISYSYLYVQVDSSVIYTKQAYELAEHLGNEAQKATVLRQEGLSYFIKGNLSEALVLFKRALSIAEKLNDKNIAGLCLSSIGLVHLQMGKYPVALKYYHQALAIFRKNKSEQNLTVILSNIGHIYLNINTIDSAHYYLEASIPFSQKYRPDFYAFIKNNLASIHLKNNEWEQAKIDLREALKAAQKYNDKHDLSDNFRLRADLFLTENKIDSALHYIQKSLSIAQESDMKANIYLAFKSYSSILEAKKDMNGALAYHKQFVIYKDSVQSMMTKNALQILEYEKEQGEIALLKLERDRQVLFTYSFIGALVLTIGIVISVLFSYKSVQKVNTNLNLANKYLQEKQEEVLVQNEEMKQYQEEIQNLNNKLALSVSKKTEELMFRNQQLTKYAFFNAHKLRSPIATILGLYELLKLNPSAEERDFIIEQISIFIVKLDEMVRKSQQLLDENHLIE